MWAWIWSKRVLWEHDLMREMRSSLGLPSVRGENDDVVVVFVACCTDSGGLSSGRSSGRRSSATAAAERFREMEWRGGRRVAREEDPFFFILVKAQILQNEKLNYRSQ
ncbi:hypothetical protein TorRG33x02_105680, partial [Trema orientale]